MRRTRGASLVSLTLSAALACAPDSSAPAKEKADQDTQTSIKHVIVVIAENRSFDHIFGTYRPKPPTPWYDWM